MVKQILSPIGLKNWKIDFASHQTQPYFTTHKREGKGREGLIPLYYTDRRSHIYRKEITIKC